MISNIFLDFFNRDSREIFGVFANTPREKHVELLCMATNIAVFLCREHCVLPPGFLAECDIARTAILRRADFVIEKLIRLPLREETLEEFWDKKHREYSPFRMGYRGLFDQKSEILLRRFSQAIMTRESKVADEILKAWQEGPDVSPSWKTTMQGFTPGQIEIIRNIPHQVRDEGFAVTWAAIIERIKDPRTPDTNRLRHVLQQHYFSVYLKEYELATVTRLPFARVNFVPSDDGLTNDYEALKAALSAIGTWELIAGMSADSMIHLRSKLGYYRFRKTFDLVAEETASAWAVGECFARAVIKPEAGQTFSKMFTKYIEATRPAHGYQFSAEEVGAIADRLGDIDMIEHEMEAIKDQKVTSTVKPPTKKPLLAICVALDMERKILVKRWKLQGGYPNLVWEGTLAGVDVVLFGTDGMGRVSAAIATMKLLQLNPTPSMLLVAGIAGGFAGEGVKRGDLLIPKSIADLATRKVGSNADKIPEFRPREFRTDGRVLKFIASDGFDLHNWESSVVAEARWPTGLRPTIHDGPVASLDEVVSSSEWVDALRDAWPKLCGVEMESGGVCAAAETFDLKVAVIRGVSDLADPAKSDDAWREIAMTTVAHLIESINFGRLLI